MQCQFCGFENPPDAAFCQRCGANLKSSPIEAASPDQQPMGSTGYRGSIPGFQAVMVTTAFGFEGYRVKQHLGIVRGLTVRSRSVVGNLAGQLQSLFGGSITAYVELCERAREEAYDLLLQHAVAVGANAVIGMRYDANDVMDGITEVLAYGTAVVIEPDSAVRQ